mgnify:CR=1 FL=1|jgi:hypothetical protein
MSHRRMVPERSSWRTPTTLISLFDLSMFLRNTNVSSIVAVQSPPSPCRACGVTGQWAVKERLDIKITSGKAAILARV